MQFLVRVARVLGVAVVAWRDCKSIPSQFACVGLSSACARLPHSRFQLRCCCAFPQEKTKSIADAEARIEDLTTKIEELTAQSARLNTEIKNHEKEVAQNQEALDKATAIREKQLAEFNAEEKDGRAAGRAFPCF